MALTLSKTGIEQSNTINAWHVTQSVDALTGAVAYDITISGSLDISDATVTGNMAGTASWASNAVSASYALSSSYSLAALSSSYSLTATSSSYALSGSYTDQADQTVKVRINNLPTNNIDYRLTFVSPTNVPEPGGADYTQLVVDSGSDGSGLYYNPNTDTLTAANITGSIHGTASYATFAETYTAPTYVSSTIYASGSAATPFTVLKLVAGASQTDVSSTATVTVAELTGKTLNQNCFITATAEEAGSGTVISVDPTGIPPNLKFNSTAPNTKFHFHIMYV